MICEPLRALVLGWQLVTVECQAPDMLFGDVLRCQLAELAKEDSEKVREFRRLAQACLELDQC